jgi:hypothetical protein
MGRLNNRAAMSAFMSANKVVGEVERVVIEPPECYNVYFFNRHNRTFFQASVLSSALVKMDCSVLCSHASTKRQIKQFDK